MPEEINRILTDRISSLLFCPTETSVDNLRSEAVDFWGGGAKVVLSGDVMLDGAMFYRDLAKKPEKISIADDFVLCTIHRAENTDDFLRLEEIISALNEIAKEKQVILPIHPRTRRILEGRLLDTTNLTIIDPVGYLNMVWLLDNCSLVMTDSGGLQKEAFFFKKCCLTLRDETEWVELVELGVNFLVGANREKIVSEFKQSTILEIDSFSSRPYGDGSASKVIIGSLLESV